MAGLPEALTEQPKAQPVFDPRFVTGLFTPRIISHQGETIRVHETNSLPLLLDAFMFYDAGSEPAGLGRAYLEQIRQDWVLQAALAELKADQELFETAAYSVFLHNQANDERGLSAPDIALAAQKDYGLSCAYVFLADKALQLDPTYDIDNFRR